MAVPEQRGRESNGSIAFGLDPPPEPGASLLNRRGYLSYYGLHRRPFGTPIDSGHLWLAPSHREVLSSLAAGIRRGDGLLLLTGDAGAGKTTLLSQLIRALGAEPLVVGLVSSPIFDVADLHQSIANAVHLGGDASDPADFAARFARALDEARAAGKRLLLILDEAQSLSDDAIQELANLVAAAALEERRFSVLLVGQEELTATLLKDRHAGLSQRISARYSLVPLSPDEVAEYIRSRLGAAGVERAIFDRHAVRRIAAISKGAPGMIDVVCEHALQAGQAREAPVIGADVVDDWRPDSQPAEFARARVAPASGRGTGARRTGRRTAVWATAIAVLSLGTAAYSLRSPGRDPITSTPPRGPAPARPAPVATPQPAPQPPAAAGETARSPAGDREAAIGDRPAQPSPDAVGVPTSLRPRDATGAPARTTPRDATGAATASTPRDVTGAPAGSTPRDAVGAPTASTPRDEAGRAAQRERREERRQRAAAPGGMAPTDETRPSDAPRPENSSDRGTGSEKPADDPGAIIDWLMKQSRKQ